MSVPAGILPFHVGRFRCLAVLDGTFRYPSELFFLNLPKEQYAPRLAGPGEPSDTIEMPYLCLYIETDRERVLVDTGAGGLAPTTGGLPRLLHGAGIDPADIDVVVLSHGHPDHIGGNLRDDGAPAFPHARHIMLASEWAYWDAGPSLGELPAADWLKQIVLITAERNLPPIRGQLDLLSAGDAVASGVAVVPAPGHTPGHMALEVCSEGEQLLFAADAFLHPLDLEYPETVAVVDHQPDRMTSTRRALLDRVAGKDTLVMASHFPFPGVGYVEATAGGWRWKMVDAAGIHR